MEEKIKFLKGRISWNFTLECALYVIFIVGLFYTISDWIKLETKDEFLSHLPYLISSVICFTLLLVCISKRNNKAEDALLQLYSEKTETDKLEDKNKWLEYHNKKAVFDTQLEIQKKIIDKILGKIDATDKENLDKLQKEYTELKNKFEEYKNNPTFQISLNDLTNKDK